MQRERGKKERERDAERERERDAQRAREKQQAYREAAMDGGGLIDLEISLLSLMKGQIGRDPADYG